MAPNNNNNPFRKLQDKHVLIIGGSSGIGLAVAEGSLAAGANVTISSSRQAKVDAAVASLAASYPDRSVRGIVKDLSLSNSSSSMSGDPDTDTDTETEIEIKLDSLFRQAITPSSSSSSSSSSQNKNKNNENENPINHVVYTAADPLSLGDLASVTADAIHKAAHMRMVVPILVAKVAARYLAPSSRESSLTLTTGSVAERPAKGWSVVSFFGGGLAALTRALAVDLAPLRVNAVRAGVVDTGLWGDMDGKREGFLVAMAEKTLTGRVGQVEDVAEAYVWLMKDGNATGTVAGTDGGSLLV